MAWFSPARRSGIADAWQAPRGKLLPDAEPIDAARRELAEEVGLDWASVELLAEHPEWIGYRPAPPTSAKAGRGQVPQMVPATVHRRSVDVSAARATSSRSGGGSPSPR
jgi:8-oxo-dGTP pyrophosphatase MutT (NUDIX family)